MSRQGKIARLPSRIREELNRRLLDGESGRKILPWLNELPETKQLIEEDFEGLRINDANLSDWRNGGYQDWLKQRERVERTKELARYAAEQSKANGSSIADGAAAIAAGKLLELLEVVDEATAEGAEDGGSKMADGGEKHLPTARIAQIAYALAALRTVEQNDKKLQLQGKSLKQKDRVIELDEQKFRRSTAEIALKVIADDRAKAIEGGSGTNAEKIEAMGKHLFGDLWQQAKKT